MLFNLDFANNTVLSCFFFSFLIIDSYFFIPSAITQIFNRIVEYLKAIEMPIKEAKAEIKIHSVIAEAKIKKVFKII